MDALLEFIFSNLFFVVILVSAIYSFIKRSVAEPEKPIQRPKRKPMQFDTDLTKYERMTEMEKENERIKMEEMSKGQEVVQRQKPSYEPKKMEGVIKVSTPKKQKRAEHKLHISKNEVIKGVIWSKILDEPRSKKPYKYRNIRG